MSLAPTEQAEAVWQIAMAMPDVAAMIANLDVTRIRFRQSADLNLFLGRRLNRSAIVDEKLTEKLTDSLTVLVNVAIK